MGHRHLFSTSNITEMDHEQVWNYLNSEPHLHLGIAENVSFTPAETVAINGVNPLPQYDLPLRSNPSSGFSSEVPNYRPSTIGTSGGYQHPTAAGSSSLIPSNYAQQGSSFYSHQTIYRGEGSDVNPQMDDGRCSFKRKSPTVPTVYDGGNTNGYYNGGSSSNFPISADQLQQKSMASSQHWAWEPSRTFPKSQVNSLLDAGDGSQRNVRSRHTRPLHVEANLAGTHLSSNLPCFHLTGDIPGPSMTGQGSHNPVPVVPHGRTPADASGFNHEMRLPLVRNSTSSVSTELCEGYHHNLIPVRNMGAPLPLHGPPRGVVVGRNNNYDRRTGPSHRSMACYSTMGHASTSSGNGGQLVPEAFSRYPRPLSIGGARNGERNVRPRSSHTRFQPYYHEGVLMDRSTFYDSRNLFDQHRDMRLDIDDMSYEELLALEERIGYVNAGLSEDMMSKCLTETIYCSSDQIQEDHEELKCAICLECYRDREELGTLNCGHDYHVDCIKKWLSMKNACPICKTSALEDTARNKNKFNSL